MLRGLFDQSRYASPSSERTVSTSSRDGLEYLAIRLTGFESAMMSVIVDVPGTITPSDDIVHQVFS
ncbi:MAG: hypothetical protein ACRDHN_07485, partial [Thermomicrobiales bacterium]